MPEQEQQEFCGDERKFDLAPNTEVELTCRLLDGHGLIEVGDKRHLASHVVDGVTVIYLWP